MVIKLIVLGQRSIYMLLLNGVHWDLYITYYSRYTVEFLKPWCTEVLVLFISVPEESYQRNTNSLNLQAAASQSRNFLLFLTFEKGGVMGKRTNSTIALK